MIKTMTLPDNLKQTSKQAIITSYGYLLSDPRWLAGLPQFNTRQKRVYVSHRKAIGLEIPYQEHRGIRTA